MIFFQIFKPYKNFLIINSSFNNSKNKILSIFNNFVVKNYAQELKVWMKQNNLNFIIKFTAMSENKQEILNYLYYIKRY